MAIAGGCRCGAVRYIIATDALPRSYACHCHQCQRWSGSAFSQQVIVPDAALSVAGPLVVYERKSEDRTSTQRICEICHGRVYNTNTRRPGVAVIRAGTLDRSEQLECVLHIFVGTKQRWVVIPDGVPTYEEWAPPEVMIATLAG